MKLKQIRKEKGKDFMDKQGYILYKKRADQFFIEEHSRQGPQHRKPPQRSVAFMIHQQKNPYGTINPKADVLQGNHETTVGDHISQYAENII